VRDRLLVERLVALLTLQVTAFAVISGYDTLTNGSVRLLCTKHGWSTNILILLYWGGPVVLYSVAEAVRRGGMRGWRYLGLWNAKRKVRRSKVSAVTPREIVATLRRAETRGELSKDELRVLEGIAAELETKELEMLNMLDDPVLWAEVSGIEYPTRTTHTRATLMEFALPCLRGQRYDSSIERLRAKQLVILGPDDLHAPVSGRDVLRPATTPLGHKLAYLVRQCQTEARSRQMLVSW
jgi:hypothetical protein